MGQIITSPDIWNIKETGGDGVFLAGGISNCPDWQAGVQQKIADATDLAVINPRRTNWDMSAGDSASYEQITWEYVHLRASKYTFFWFPKETDGPITLFELGSALERDTKVFVGCHPEYNRKLDIHAQVMLRQPDTLVLEDLDVLTHMFIKRIQAGTA